MNADIRQKAVLAVSLVWMMAVLCVASGVAAEADGQDIKVYEPRESGPVRVTRNPDRTLDDFTVNAPLATVLGNAKFNMAVEPGEAPCGGAILRVDLPATHQRGAHGLELFWKLPVENRDWSGFDQFVVWFESPKGGAIDLSREGGVWYGRGVIIGFRDKTGKWFEAAADVLPYMGGTWIPLRIRFSRFDKYPRRLDLRNVDTFKIRLVSSADHDLAMKLANVGLEKMPAEFPEIAIQARKTGYLTSPGSDFTVQLVAARIPAGKTGEVIFRAQDYWGKTTFERKLTFPDSNGSLEQEIVLPISAPGYFDLSATMSVDGKEVWRAYRGLASLSPLSKTQTDTRKTSIFSIWTGYHESLGAGIVRKFLVLPQNSSDISPEGIARGVWKVPGPPEGTLGICCVVPTVWGRQWFDPATTQEQYDEFARNIEKAVRMAADGRFPYYEVINEPNAKYWGPMKNLVDYHKLVAAAIKRGDPKAKVGGPCPYGIHVDYIEKFLEAGGDKVIDFISIHGYAKEEDFRKGLKDLRAMLARRGFQNMEILITEKGESLPSTTPEEQAQAIPRFYAIAMSEGVRAMTWHTYMGNIDRSGDRGINNAASDFNIVRSDGSANPAFVAYGIMTRMLLGATAIGEATGLPESCRGFEFRKPGGGRLLVLWRKAPGAETVKLPEGGWTTLTDIMGVARPVARAADGAASVEASENPVYIGEK